jgi:hypothetical protein
MLRLFGGFLAALAVTLCLAPLPARAADIIYTSRAAFGAANPGATVQTFDTVAAPFVIPNGTNFQGVVYTSSDGNPLITNLFLALSPPNTLGEDVNGFFLPTDVLTLTFPTPITAFGISFNTFATDMGAYTLTTNAGSVIPSFFDPFPGAATGQFAGFSTDTPFTTVTVLAPGGLSYTADNVTYAVAGVVPEPSAFALLGLGTAGLLAYGWRRRRLAA